MEKQYWPDNQERFLKIAKEYLSIASISTQDRYKPEIKKAVEWLVSRFRKLGLKAEIWESSGHPFVFAATKADPRKPTILIYGHYDVQPPEPLAEWQSPPFTPTIRNGAVYARGTTDNKMQHLIYLFALEYLIKKKKSLGFNVKFIIEGEEEVGSVSTAKVLPKYRSRLKSDLVLVSDGPMVAKGLPTIITGTRGLLYTELEIETGKKDLHSGLFGGGVENPANLLSWLITKIKGRGGKVLIPGFYQDVIALGEKEKAIYDNFPISEEDFRKNAQVKKVWPEKGYSAYEATRVRPTMDVNGIWSGYTQPGSKTIIPNKATAKISFRLVPKQDPDKIYVLFERYLGRIIPATAKWTLKKDAVLRPYVWEGDQRWQSLAAKALEEFWAKKPIIVREGGSIGILDFFKKQLGMESLLVNFGSPDDNLHAPNEKFDLENLKKGFLFAVKFLCSEFHH